MVEVVEKVLKKKPDSIRKYVRGEKIVLIVCYLAGMVYIILSFLSLVLNFFDPFYNFYKLVIKTTGFECM